MLKTLLFSFLVLGGSALAQEGAEDNNNNNNNGHVISLTEENFDSTIMSADISLVKFFAPWCGHCKHLAPEYAMAANELKGKVLFAEVDCTVETGLAERYGVRGYPTLKIFRKDPTAPFDYNGPRDSNGIVRYMVKQSEPAITEITDDVWHSTVTSNNDIAIVMYTTDRNSAAYKAFESLAYELRETTSFGVVSDAALIASFGKTDGSIVAYRNFDGERVNGAPKAVVYDAAAFPDLRKWAALAGLPAAALYTHRDSAAYQRAGLPRLTVFAKNLRGDANPAGVRYVLNRLRKVAPAYFGKLAFVAMDTETNEFAECGFEEQQMKQQGKYFIAILDKTTKYCLNDADMALKGLKPADIEAYAAAFVEGKLTPYLKSQPLPDPAEENGVKIIVGKTLQEEVVDADKDVFLAVYAPWCGHCKHLLPVWEELAVKHKDSNDKLVIAKIDGTANDVPSDFEFSGFPTIFWVKAGKGAKPVTYNGDRTVEAFEKFINEHKSFGTEEVPSKDEL